MKNVAIFNTCISGSTGKIAVGLFEKLNAAGYNSFFLYGRQDGIVGEHYYKIGSAYNKYLHAGLARFFGLQGFGSVLPTKKMLKYLNDNDIDTIFIVSPHGYYINEKQLWNYIIKNKIKTIYLMIDEYAYLGNCGYRDGCDHFKNKCINCPKAKYFSKYIQGASHVFRMKEKVYREYDNIVFVGPKYTIIQAQLSPLMIGKKMYIVDEAVNTDFYTPKDTDGLRAELGILNDQKVCVCVAPFSYERKGCKYFLELARRFENDPNYLFIQVGFNVDDKSVKMPSNYIPIGFLSDQELLAQYYSLGDLFVFPSLLDTMPNACLEALSAGTPLLLFNISGMPYIADDTVASFVEAKNVDQMEQVVRCLKKKNKKTINKCRAYALKRYDNKKYYDRLIRIAEGVNIDDTL